MAPRPHPRESLGYLVADLGRLFGRVFDRRVAHLDLTRAQWRALKRLACAEGATQVELADQLDMEPIAVGRVIDRLQKAGFVERRADPADRRVWRLYLRPQSAQVTDEVEAVARLLRKDATAGIGSADLATTLSVLGRVRANLTQLDREGRGEPSPKS
ncbi:MarR family transcriptional regulator [Pseudoxanthomonas broegbernensis]|uniref:MarR family transcriptional regulator n=1 Tax=Pseudoxanthomonas broegbernensis TaxID=83619 RepID=A0A7V8GNU7_9GAMM|nr:MarR family transcriptional regulator [Pseudoxanthomonas broegbernensis]KAF1687322.1 MarR family transcriptional regulator [Pseudoxanthomonas broegbernensis]MBB6065679.1 DNA-binding MarR family transcriptional regulator [Pseudoxanthomonas broegbernensis]